MKDVQIFGTARAARWHRKARQALLQGDLDAAGQACARLIEIEPNHADAYFMAAICSLESGNPTHALIGFETATSLVDNQADYWAYQARCLAVLGRYDDARLCADRAIALPTDSAVTHDTLGNVFTRVARHAEAAEQFQLAADLAPDNAQHRFHLGTSLTYCGELDRAETAFEQALDIDPDHSHSHLALSEMLDGSPPAGRIELLEAALDRAAGNIDRELVISQALAKTLEAAGETVRAFSVWEQSKNAKKESNSYTIDEDRSIFTAFHEVFGEEMRPDQRPGNPSQAPIFVVGMPRTGTTLVERILASHPAIVSGGEMPNFPRSILEASGGQTAGIIDIDSLSAALDADPGGIGSRYLETSKAIVADAERFVDKLPLNFFLIGFIRRSLPNARIVCLHRNPLDTCLANFRQLFALNFPNYRYALSLTDTAEYFAMFSRLIAFWDEQFPGALHHLQYEKLVADPEPEIRSLLEYLGVEFVPEVLDFENNDAPVATASAVQVRRPIYADSVEAWRRYEKELEPVKRQLTELGIDINPAPRPETPS